MHAMEMQPHCNPAALGQGDVDLLVPIWGVDYLYESAISIE